ncbi:hypothetical protein ISN44_As03g040610 [Arabidopsis suecica]|uniref:Uncharacterized protein n=1 Tax=Arabidopsis suecica TaxID=45249 RepID=A0A8T2FGX0_ARASU|nr:hypothetical protein ISN44_As03g040610 [Arabidopsis suecica]
MSSDTQADMAVFGFLRIDGHLVHHLRDGLVLQYTSTLYHSIISLSHRSRSGDVGEDPCISFAPNEIARNLSDELDDDRRESLRLELAL